MSKNIFQAGKPADCPLLHARLDEGDGPFAASDGCRWKPGVIALKLRSRKGPDAGASAVANCTRRLATSVGNRMWRSPLPSTGGLPAVHRVA